MWVPILVFLPSYLAMAPLKLLVYVDQSFSILALLMFGAK